MLFSPFCLGFKNFSGCRKWMEWRCHGCGAMDDTKVGYAGGVGIWKVHIYPWIGPFDDFLAYPDPAPELFLHFSHLHRTLNPFQPRSYPFMRCVLMERVVWP